jgi:predicted amidophosphoribosyltransferase
MGNRLLEGVCILCGGPIIQPNSWGCCSACVPKIKAMVLDAKKNPGKRKKIKIKHGR